ncbi:calmodulin-binding transcription activator 2-like isoform X2 [Heterodontus francisci]|uniref:calmodulin-binding transcription activator 2-like isoform X2 n=1 Tax=Heterodontus francisci TaxID=7792 RepID=UPI00355C5780
MKPEDNNNHIKVFLPNKLMDCLPKCAALPKERQRWNTNEEIASYLTAFEKHEEWLSGAPRTRPLNGSIILYNRKKVKYRKDGYCWKKRKDGKTTREDHMKLKVQGMECLYGCYVHSSIIPTFHRRCYWLLQNPDIVLVHYLNVPIPEDCGKMCGPILCSVNSDRKEWLKWSKEELICQLKPMFHCIKWTCSNGNGATELSVEQLVHQVLESHQAKPQPRTHTCLCNSGLGTTGSIPHKCNNTKHRIISPKVDIRLSSYSALTEVQNLSAAENKNEQDESKTDSQDRKVVKLSKAVLQVNDSSEVSSSNALEDADSARESPATRTNGYYDRELGSVAIATSVPNLTVATVTCSIPRNAVILMTGIGDKPVSLGGSGLTPSQQLIATSSNSQGLPLSGHDLSLAPPTSSIGLTLVPSSVGGLVLSQAVESNMDTSETSTAFDPDSFLNSPKQGQTYGGGGSSKEASTISTSFTATSLSNSGFPSSDLKKEPDCKSETLEKGTVARPSYRIPPVSSDVSTFPQSSSLVSATQTFPVTAKVSLVPCSLGSSTLLENMDYNNAGSPKNYTGIFSQHTPASSSLPQSQNRFFIKDKSHVATSVASPTVSQSLKAEPISHFPQEHRESRSIKEELSSSVQMVAFQGVVPEVEISMDTTSQLNGDTEMARMQKNMEMEQAVKPEGHYNVSRTTDDEETLEIQCSHVTDLYTIIQNDLSSSSVSSSNMDLNIDHFDISFDSQFPDLISDFMTDSSADPNGGFGQYSSSPTPVTPTQRPGQNVSTKYPELSAQMGSYAQQQQQQPPQQLVSTANNNLPFTEVSVTPSDSTQASPVSTMENGQAVTITDFSPEWSYPEGGVKVLITGPWSDDNDRYSCMFDQITVPASLIQSGVLRCYCPAHEAGLVRLQVARENLFISNLVLFEYRARNSMALPSSQLDWLSLDDNQFRMSILERLEQMEKRMAEMTASNPSQQQKVRAGDEMHVQASSDSFEERIIAVCETMMSRSSWLQSERLIHGISFRGMTLLHLAAAQGYARLIETLIKWRTVNAESLDLEQEVDPLNVDHFSCTPLMWACALGHVEAAVSLYGWNSQALTIPDSLGRLPLHVARSRGHVRLAMRLEELQRHDGQLQGSSLRPKLQDMDGIDTNWQLWNGSSPEAGKAPSPLSMSPDTGLSTVSSNSSPSSLSEGSGPLSVTSAYSSSSVHRDSPVTSPELCPTAERDIAMEICEPQPGQNAISSVPKDHGRIALCIENAGAAANKEKSGNLWYLYEDSEPRKTRNASSALHCSTAESHFFLDYQATLVTNSTRQFTMATGRDSMETELLRFSENAENEEFLPSVDVLQVDMITLAEQIIDATPDRIKQEDFNTVDTPLKERQGNAAINDTMTWLASYLENVDQLPNFSQHRSACSQPLTPPSNPCLSPVSSPLSDITFEKVDTSANTDWSDFLNASANGKMESEFALLTLSDHEQRELYEAARIIQTAFRKYKGRRLKEQQEIAAAVIQRCYRKYKQYALYKKMTQAAILIQSKFRSYYEQKRFQQSRRAAVLIQQYYRSYKEYEKLKQGHRGSGPLQQKLKATFLTKRQDQAARKIMRFLRRCRHRMKELKQSQELEGVQKRGLTT